MVIEQVRVDRQSRRHLRVSHEARSCNGGIPAANAQTGVGVPQRVELVRWRQHRRRFGRFRRIPAKAVRTGHGGPEHGLIERLVTDRLPAHLEFAGIDRHSAVTSGFAAGRTARPMVRNGDPIPRPISDLIVPVANYYYLSEQY